MVNFVELIGNRSLARLLAFFLSEDNEYSQIEVIKKTKISKATLIKLLRKLEKNQIIEFRRIGVSKLYKLQKDNPIVKQLKILQTLMKLSKLKNLNNNVKIYLYGSSARGENTTTSDIDLLIIGKIHKEEIMNYIKNISDKIKINFEIFTPQEWSEIIKKDPAFYERVEKDKIEVINGYK